MTDTGVYKVTAKQLRKFAQQSFDWEVAAKSNHDVIIKLRTKIDRLETKLSLLELEEPITVDLFA